MPLGPSNLLKTVVAFGADLLTRRPHPVDRVPVFFDAAYRLPLTTLQARTGLEPRRAELALWFLQDLHLVGDDEVRAPQRVGYEDLARVHTPEWLDKLADPGVLASVFGLEAWDVPVDSVMTSLRTACGGTLGAARVALERQGPTLNLLGGFHHAHPDKGGGFCAVNDVAVALAALRAEGWQGNVGILDLDAHPPDGTLACLQHGRGTQPGMRGPEIGRAQWWLGSLSGAEWGHLPGADETLLPTDCDDATYLAALEALLERMPACDLYFVLAGGDVLQGDPLGRLGLTMDGVWTRDLRVQAHLHGKPSVWLPAGGYRPDAWQVLAGTGWILAHHDKPRIAPDADPLRRHFRLAAREIPDDALGGWQIDAADIEESLGLRPAGGRRFLGFYTAEGIELALWRLGILSQIERLGYRDLRVSIEAGEPQGPDRLGDLMRVTGVMTDRPDERHVLVEVSLERRIEPQGAVLFVHWLTLRHPRGAFARGPAPGQDAPGLGMAREASELLAGIAERLGLQGVVLRPAYFHVAYVARHRYRFRDPRVQGRFEALVRDLRACPDLHGGPTGFLLGEASRAVAAGRVQVQRDGGPWQPWRWEAEEMIDALKAADHPGRPQPDGQVDAERAAVRFRLL